MMADGAAAEEAQLEKVCMPVPKECSCSDDVVRVAISNIGRGA